MFIKNISLIFFSVLGISATFMPWLHYPKGNGVIYGYLVDGIVTGFVFFLILLYSLLTLKKRHFNSIFSFIIAGLGFLMAVASYSYILELEAEKLNFKTENPMIAIATAGFHQGIGIYIFGIAGLGVFLTILLHYLFKVFNTKSTISNQFSNNANIVIKYGTYLVIIILIASMFFALFKNKNQNITQDSVRTEITKEISGMGKALANGDYNSFIDYNHPVMIQSYGGREKAISLIQAAMDELKSSGTTIRDVSLADIYDIKYEADNIQAIITQQVIFDENGKDKKEIQKMIAVSEDGGANWHFININGKTKAEMFKFFPVLNPNLKF